MKTVVITGVSRGLGKCLAEKFLSEGWKVIGSSTSGESELKNANLEVYKLDISDSALIGEFVKKVGNRDIDILINCAGIYPHNEDGNVVVDTLRTVLTVNLIGPIDLTERLLPRIKKGGHIVNISSESGAITGQVDNYSPSYNISKIGVNMYTRTLADRLKKDNTTVSCVNPGWMKTDMGGEHATKDPVVSADEIYKLAVSKVESGFFWEEGKKRDW